MIFMIFLSGLILLKCIFCFELSVLLGQEPPTGLNSTYMVYPDSQVGQVRPKIR